MLVSDIPALRDCWYPISYSGHITAEPKPFHVFGESSVAWRGTEGGPVSAAFDECPRRPARLFQGWIADGCLVCL